MEEQKPVLTVEERRSVELDLDKKAMYMKFES